MLTGPKQWRSAAMRSAAMRSKSIGASVALADGGTGVHSRMAVAPHEGVDEIEWCDRNNQDLLSGATVTIKIY